MFDRQERISKAPAVKTGCNVCLTSDLELGSGKHFLSGGCQVSSGEIPLLKGPGKE
jgi:hypothetical protein